MRPKKRIQRQQASLLPLLTLHVQTHYPPSFTILGPAYNLNMHSNMASSRLSLNKRNKHRVYVGLYHRGDLSLPNNDRQLSPTYHWGILMSPKSPRGSDSHTFDVNDGDLLDGVNRVDRNPARNWHLRHKKTSTHLRLGAYLFIS
ncbi:hypothetical protein N7509_008074 [Penicillium cosmopolitanum]|uniref:Uncharacterized protein n=1 Tax=Penicillium cosmopolitanum TaxID=1131564 RepID=A0A9X0B8Z2_9EURO|nr:uncharacterized protein N7509_008074 [Penicillium cosmopolitanum]KAJ5392584.1 hypothetical protein N7509_008074 [Penicillium cosmopolitanum]